MSRKQESITLSISLDHKAKLEQRALEFDCLCGSRPNISALLKAIADGEILLSKSGKPDKRERKMIKDAINCIQSALTILMELI